MIKLFIQWLELFDIKKKDLRVKLHLYSDMDIQKGLDFWSKELRIPKSQFLKSYIKETTLASITYKNGFGKGTCCVMFSNVGLWEYVTMGLKHISDISYEDKIIRP